MGRFLIAYDIPEEFHQNLSELCRLATGKPLEIERPHITIIPPFYLASHTETQSAVDQISRLLNQYADQPITATATRLGQFSQDDGCILFLEIEPVDRFTMIHNELQKALADRIQLDTSPYASGIVPEFKPHLSITYNSAEISIETQQTVQHRLENMNLEWNLEPPTLRMEQQPGVWVTMGSNH